MSRPRLRYRRAEDLGWHPLVRAIERLLDATPGADWTGSPTSLLAALTALERPHIVNTIIWPRNALSLSLRLEGFVATLRRRQIIFSRSSGRGHRRIRLARLIEPQAGAAAQPQAIPDVEAASTIVSRGQQ